MTINYLALSKQSTIQIDLDFCIAEMTIETDDEDDPPLLVESEDQIQTPEDANRVRVPITIVTGMHRLQACSSPLM